MAVQRRKSVQQSTNQSTTNKEAAEEVLFAEIPVVEELAFSGRRSSTRQDHQPRIHQI
jgi:hypothetical protein